MPMRWKWIFIFMVVQGCIISTIGFPRSLEELSANWQRNIRLGLDLKGGTQMGLEVQIQDAFKAEADRTIELLERTLAKENIRYRSMETRPSLTAKDAEEIEIHLRGLDPRNKSDIRSIVERELQGQWTVSPDADGDFKLKLPKDAALRLRQETITQTIRTIERRIDEYGIAENTIQQRGGDRSAEILIQLPGVDDPERVNRILKTTALLEFSEVIDGPFPSQEEARSTQLGISTNTKTVQSPQGWWLLASSPVVSGRDLRDAQARRGESGGWDTGFVLSAEAARRFEQFTQTHIHKRMAIVLDNNVVSAPRIDSAIAGEGRITGAASAQEAADLALNLRAGSLPAGVKVLEQHRVGASLGEDSIRQGLTAGIIGLVLVIASMVAYYRGAGVNAVLALLLNTGITVAVLSTMGAAWTLPGIAGLVLSIGMAVDSNVLIFERIKEETRAGKAVATAIASGFDRAIGTIVDTHITTVVASAFLFIFGTLLVRGFAVTLVVGLAANLFTAVFVSRALFDLQLRRKPRLAKLSIGGGRLSVFERANFDFMRNRKWTLGLSAVMIAISLSSIFGYGLRPGLDFRGGAQMNVKFLENPGIETVRQTLTAMLPGEFVVQEGEAPGEFIVSTVLTNEKSLEEMRNVVEQALGGIAGRNGSFEVRSAGLVSPRAGADMRQRAIMATAGALGGMLVYIAYRFKWTSGAAAVIATIHDVVVTLGLFALTGREINLTIIAALLTLIGYSMNDKIVVFDRVRENQRLRRISGSFLQLVNDSINQTLSRTVLTAGPTLLACLALYFWGGDVLNGIAFALFVGIVAGTYSSIFVASALLVMWQHHQN